VYARCVLLCEIACPYFSINSYFVGWLQMHAPRLGLGPGPLSAIKYMDSITSPRTRHTMVHCFAHPVASLITQRSFALPTPGFSSRAQSTPCIPSARPLRTGTAPSALPMRPCRCPWALGVGARPVAPPGGALIRTARAAARAASCYNRIRRRVAKCENTDFSISWRPFLALEIRSREARICFQKR
jgi:hypothetical protein